MSHYDCPCMEKCPLHHAMALIGGKWKVQILCAVTNAGAVRYNALRARLDGISNTVLASALRELERDGLLLSPGASIWRCPCAWSTARRTTAARCCRSSSSSPTGRKRACEKGLRLFSHGAACSAANSVRQ